MKFNIITILALFTASTCKYAFTDDSVINTKTPESYKISAPTFWEAPCPVVFSPSLPQTLLFNYEVVCLTREHYLSQTFVERV